MKIEIAFAYAATPEGETEAQAGRAGEVVKAEFESLMQGIRSKLAAEGIDARIVPEETKLIQRGAETLQDTP